MSLSREQILQVADRKTLEVPVPEWGGSIFVRSLSGTERDAFDAVIRQSREAGQFETSARARFAAVLICDESGEALFSASDVEALGRKSGAVLTRVLDKGMELNAMREKDLKELEKNS